MAKTIRTCDGDRLDTLCYQYYGRVEGTVEAVLVANPGLASIPQPYDAGHLIFFPDIAHKTEKLIQLWS